MKAKTKDPTTIELEKTLSGRHHIERLKIRPKEKEFYRALDTLIEAIRDHMADGAMALEWGPGPDTDVVWPLHQSFDPRIKFERKFLEATFKDFTDRELSIACDDALSNLQLDISRIHFAIGLLMGAALKGATVDELKRIGANWWYRA